MSSQQTVPWWRGGLHEEKLMSINGWTYLVIKIIIFMNGAYIRVCRTVLIQVKRNRFTGALLVPSVTADQPVYGAGLVAAALVDLQQRSFPAWFRGLCFLLNFFAVISLLLRLYQHPRQEGEHQQAVREQSGPGRCPRTSAPK